MSKRSHNSRCPGCCYYFNLPGEAEAKKDSTIAEAKADEQRMEAKLSNDTEIARWGILLNKTNCQLVQSNFHQGQEGL